MAGRRNPTAADLPDGAAPGSWERRKVGGTCLVAPQAMVPGRMRDDFSIKLLALSGYDLCGL